MVAWRHVHIVCIVWRTIGVHSVRLSMLHEG